MITVEIVNNKIFMNTLLKGNLFDSFEVRTAVIQTFIKFEISGTLDKSYYSISEQENINNEYCLWKDLKPIIFQLIKGNKLPKFIKIVLSLTKAQLQEFDSEAEALFLNIIFENGKINCITGCSQKNFSLDKKLETKWDEYIKEFFVSNNINI